MSFPPLPPLEIVRQVRGVRMTRQDDARLHSRITFIQLMSNVHVCVSKDFAGLFVKIREQKF